MSKIFPSKIFGFGTHKEAWEVEMEKSLDKSLANTFHTIKTNTGSRIVQKSVYIDHLIAQERKIRLKAELDRDEE